MMPCAVVYQTPYQVVGGDTAPADASASESQGSCFQPKSYAILCSQTIIEGRAALSISTNRPKCDINWKLYGLLHHRPTELNVCILRPIYVEGLKSIPCFFFSCISGPLSNFLNLLLLFPGNAMQLS